MKTKLSIIIIACALTTALIVPSVANADEPIQLEAGTILLEEATGYDVYFNPETKTYKFVRNSIWFWEDDIPDKYRPSDEQVKSALKKVGMNEKKVHKHKDYSAEYPTTLIYREYDTDNYVMLTSGLPQVTSIGELIDCKWNKTIGNVYISGANWFEAVVDGIRVSVTSEIGSVSWSPQLFLNDIEKYPSKVTVLAVDPVNSNYSYNILQWDYGVAKRWVRVIEGRISEWWIVESNPYGEVRIKHNATGSLRLPLVGSVDASDRIIETIITEDEEIVPASSFNGVVYPVEIGASPLTVFSSASDGSVWNTDTGYAVTHNAVNGDTIDATNIRFWHANNDVGGGDFQIYRSFPYFDTSSIGAGATITAATFALYGKGAPVEADANHPDIAIVEGVQDTPLNLGNYGDNEPYHIVGSDYIDVSAGFVGAYQTVNLNATGMGWINQTGTTLFCTRNRGDIGIGGDLGNGTQPTGFNDATAYANEQGVGFQPRLVVTYLDPPVVTSSPATNVEETSATLHGNVTSTGGDATVDQRGFVYDTVGHADPGNVAPGASGYASSWADAGGPWGTGIFDSGANIVGLTEGELYYFRAYTHNVSAGYDYSNTEQKFLTKPDEPTNLAVVVGGAGQLNLTWTTGTGFDTTYIRRAVGAYPALGTGTLVYNAAGVSYNDTGLTGGLDYYYRAWSWCTEGALERYSDLTSDAHEIALSAPITACNLPTDFLPPSLTLMYCSANVTSLGGLASYDERGFVWGTTSLADPGNTAITATAYDSYWSETGTWNAIIDTYNHTPTLVEGTTYYIRAGAHNASYWGYSSEIAFSTFDQVIWYQPIDIIVGTALPDREGTQDGVFSWGSNPAGITVTIGGLTSTEAPPVTGVELETPSILPIVSPPEGYFPDEEVMAMPDHIWYGWLNPIAEATDTPVQFFWWLLCGMAMLFVIVLVQRYTKNLMLTGIAAMVVVGAGISMFALPFWFIIIGILAVLAAITMGERQPSL